MVTPESHLTKLEVASSKRIIFNVANISSIAKGSVPIQAPTFVEIKTFSNDTIDLTFSDIIIKNKAPVVGTSMEGEASIRYNRSQLLSLLLLY